MTPWQPLSVLDPLGQEAKAGHVLSLSWRFVVCRRGPAGLRAGLAREAPRVGGGVGVVFFNCRYSVQSSRGLLQDTVQREGAERGGW